MLDANDIQIITELLEQSRNEMRDEMTALLEKHREETRAELKKYREETRH